MANTYGGCDTPIQPLVDQIVIESMQMKSMRDLPIPKNTIWPNTDGLVPCPSYVTNTL